MTFLKNFNKSANAGSAPSFNPRLLYPVLSAETLLAGGNRQQLLKIIHDLSQLSESDYNLVYPNLINNFSEFVQLLPSNMGGRIASLLDEGLLRAITALQLQKEHATAAEDLDPLETYALFSAMLLADVGRVMTQYVTFCDEEGHFLEEWLPYHSSMTAIGGHYKARPLGMWSKLSRAITPILARQIMPESGFLWLGENYQLLQNWLAILADDEGGAGNFKHILVLIPERLDIFSKQNQLPPISTMTIEPFDVAFGEDFIEWLSKGLADNSIVVNDPEAGVHLVEEGLLLEPKIFQDFCDGYPKCKDWTVVSSKVNALGLSKLSGGDKVFEQYFGKTADPSSNVKLSQNYFLGGINKIEKTTNTKPTTNQTKFMQHSSAPNKLSAQNKSLKKEGLVINPQVVYLNKSTPQQLADYLEKQDKKARSKRLLKKILHKLRLERAAKFHPRSFKH